MASKYRKAVQDSITGNVAENTTYVRGRSPDVSPVDNGGRIASGINADEGIHNIDDLAEPFHKVHDWVIFQDRAHPLFAERMVLSLRDFVRDVPHAYGFEVDDAITKALGKKGFDYVLAHYLRLYVDATVVRAVDDPDDGGDREARIAWRIWQVFKASGRKLGPAEMQERIKELL